jgi:two-component system, NtrC family, response regulator HydG
MNNQETWIEGKPHILVVDDDLETRELLQAFFQPKGYITTLYDDPERALEDLSREKIRADVILTDLMLPHLSGIEFTKKLRASGVETPIVLITSKKSMETVIEAIEAGAYDFVVKPLHLTQLMVSVGRALHLNKIKSENSTLRTAVQIKEGTVTGAGIIGRSPGFLKVLDLARRVAQSDATVFISGESGTGKEVIAKAIHNMGARGKAPFVAINCSSIPEHLLESELFGHTKGAFTGASEKKIGLFEEAEEGTLFLDEIGDLSLPLQAKLLRVLQERKIKRIGENQFRKIDVRILCATHKDLRREVAEGRFRDDLFFRLNVIEIKIPPLRERKEDIVPLAEFFLKKYVALNRSSVTGFSKTALEKLWANSWPGNVRELENAIERAVVLSTSDLIQEEDLPEEEDFGSRMEGDDVVLGDKENFYGLASDKLLTVDELVKRYIKFALKTNNGVKEKTAQDLNIDRKTLYRKIQEMESGGNGSAEVH